MQKIAFSDQAVAAEPLLWNYPEDKDFEGYMVLVTHPSVSPFNKKKIEPGAYPHPLFVKLTGMNGDQAYPIKLSPTIHVKIGTPAPPIKASGFTVQSPTNRLQISRSLVDKFVSEGYLTPESQY